MALSPEPISRELFTVTLFTCCLFFFQEFNVWSWGKRSVFQTTTWIKKSKCRWPSDLAQINSVSIVNIKTKLKTDQSQKDSKEALFPVMIRLFSEKPHDIESHSRAIEAYTWLMLQVWTTMKTHHREMPYKRPTSAIMHLNKQRTVSIKITVCWENRGNTQTSHVLLNSGAAAVTWCFDVRSNASRRGEGL